MNTTCFKCEAKLDGFEGFSDNHSYCSDCYYDMWQKEMSTKKMRCNICKTVLEYNDGTEHLKQNHSVIHIQLTAYYNSLEILEKGYEGLKPGKEKRMAAIELDKLYKSIERMEKSIYHVL